MTRVINVMITWQYSDCNIETSTISMCEHIVVNSTLVTVHNVPVIQLSKYLDFWVQYFWSIKMEAREKILKPTSSGFFSQSFDKNQRATRMQRWGGGCGSHWIEEGVVHNWLSTSAIFKKARMQWKHCSHWIDRNCIFEKSKQNAVQMCFTIDWAQLHF